MSNRWDPEQYLRFQDERSRPFDDLLARIPPMSPREVVDLGCGPGTTTAQLEKRWPSASITGVDSSAEMIARAEALQVPGRLQFRLGDLRHWQPETPVDVLLSCATLQWIPGHLDLFPSFIASLAPGGVFAFQVPGNFDQPSHVLIHELATTPRWKELLGGAVAAAPSSHPPTEYLRALLATGADADVWETTYLHVLGGPDAVLEWVKGTGLRPVLQALDEGAGSQREDFLEIYSNALREAYPVDSENRVIFPFRRIFAVARVASR